MAHIGNVPFGKTVRTVTSETLTSVKTAYYPTGGYIVGYVDVYVNGVRLTETADFTATDGTTVTLQYNPSIGDTVDVVTYGSIELANAVRRDGDTLVGTLYTRALVPTANITYDIGTSTMRYKDLYLSGNTINLGDIQLTTNSTSFRVSNTTGGTFPSALANTTITGTLTANATTITGNVSVTGNTTLTGTLTANATIVSGNLSVTGNTVVTGVVNVTSLSSMHAVSALSNTYSYATLEVINTDASATRYFQVFRTTRGANTIGSITGDTSGTGTTYNTTSDYRLKTNIQPILDSKERIKKLNPIRHGWVSNSDIFVDGFLAHQVQEAGFEYAVTGVKDDIVMQSMDYGRITPVIVAALQEAIKEIEQLKNRIKELESK